MLLTRVNLPLTEVSDGGKGAERGIVEFSVGTCFVGGCFSILIFG
jgi:hypothetical protein